jgi:hypothetical protein
MPTLQQLHYLEITPEKFIDNCSPVELQEVILLANARLNRMEKTPATPEPVAPKPEPAPLPPGPEKEHKKQLRFRWTLEEVDILRELYPTTSAEELAKKLNRHPDAIMMKAGKLGIKKQKKATSENTAGFDSPEGKKQRREKELAQLRKAKARYKAEQAAKKLITVHLDSRTTLRVPEDADMEALKEKYLPPIPNIKKIKQKTQEDGLPEIPETSAGAPMEDSD